MWGGRSWSGLRCSDFGGMGLVEWAVVEWVCGGMDLLWSWFWLNAAMGLGGMGCGAVGCGSVGCSGVVCGGVGCGGVGCGAVSCGSAVRFGGMGLCRNGLWFVGRSSCVRQATSVQYIVIQVLPKGFATQWQS